MRHKVREMESVFYTVNKGINKQNDNKKDTIFIKATNY